MQQNEEDGADVESAQSEVCWARIQFNVTRKEEKGEEKRTAETECALASEEQKDCRLGRNAVECCWQAVTCREGWTCKVCNHYLEYFAPASKSLYKVITKLIVRKFLDVRENDRHFVYLCSCRFYNHSRPI